MVIVRDINRKFKHRCALIYTLKRSFLVFLLRKNRSRMNRKKNESKETIK